MARSCHTVPEGHRARGRHLYYAQILQAVDQQGAQPIQKGIGS